MPVRRVSDCFKFVTSLSYALMWKVGSFVYAHSNEKLKSKAVKYLTKVSYTYKTSV